MMPLGFLRSSDFVYELNKPRSLLGRSKDSDIVCISIFEPLDPDSAAQVLEGSRSISSRHAMLEIDVDSGKVKKLPTCLSLFIYFSHACCR